MGLKRNYLVFIMNWDCAIRSFNISKRGEKSKELLAKRKEKYYFDPEFRKKSMAQSLVNQIVSIPLDVCEKCGSTKSLHKHHPDYNEPLYVFVLCQKCHMGEHKNIRLGKPEFVIPPL